VIRIARAPEPAALAPVREDRLVAARQALLQGTKIAFEEYDVVKRELAAMQHNKCCYCEKREEQAKYRDVEHYRPKSLYWWLAWTWENLLFACIDCNREQKRDQFPQEPSGTPLVAEQVPPAGERPLVIDPSDPSVEPTTEIVFLRERIHGKERWVPRGMSARGRKTIDVCGLDRPNLLDLYAEHVNHTVRAKLGSFFAADAEGDAQAAFKAWETARRGLLARERPFRALSHDALCVLVPAGVRERHRLTLERPTP
jgi:uncharacterized protein (TIGR02646 family)